MAAGQQKDQRLHPYQYLIPRGYVGWIRVDFNVKAAPPLPVEGNYYVVRIPATGYFFSSLRLWQDRNHNGVSEPAELFTLPALRLKTLHLDYQTKKKADEFGNGFRYRAKVKDDRDAQLGRWAWDVFLVSVR